jgi:hypothetical protein
MAKDATPEGHMPEPQAAYDAATLAAEQDAALALTAPPSAARLAAYVVATDGRLIRIARGDGEVELTIAGRHPLTLDRHQAAALQAVLDDVLAGGF